MQENSIVFNQVTHRAQMVISQVREFLVPLLQSVNEDFVRCADYLSKHDGTVIFTGIGKSASIAQKLSVTFASLGMPAFFVHPTEMGHGDLGNITGETVVIALSNSGETAELVSILSIVKRRAKQLIALVGNAHSSMAAMADICLVTGAVKEACHLGLAPTTSTTVSLVFGDALAVCTAELRGLAREDFAKTHPSGRLGQMTTLTLQDVMCPIDKCSVVLLDDSLQSSIISMAQCGQSVSLVSQDEKIVGLQTIDLVNQAKMLCGELSKVPNAQYLTPLVMRLSHDLLVCEALALTKMLTDRYFVVFDADRAVGLLDVSQWR